LFGIDPNNMFGFWDWVGGRYSLWSAVGLSLAVLIGMDGFEELLLGGHEMDQHFASAPWEQNLPVIMGLLGIWNTNLLAVPTHVVLPYDYALRRFPDYLQQLEMESNGKRVSRDGGALTYETCPVLWGGPGNNGQHAFYQLLHQGTRPVAADFIVAAEGQSELAEHQHKVLANAFAQAEALMRGRNAEEARAELEASGIDDASLEAQVAHRAMPGNQPTSTLLYRRLTPRILGALIALYEHKVFVQSVCWGINAFDQWGVELGKQLAGRILPELDSEQDIGTHDSSTNGLINRVRHWRAGSA
jgi:glucose-6-phosphate isomerase